MAGGKGVYLQNKVLNLMGGGTLTFPTHLFLALLTTVPTDGTMATAVEVTGSNAYARVQITPNTTNFPASTAGSVSNGAAFTFLQATADYPAPVVGWALLDALTSGNLWYWGTCTSNTVHSGDTPTVLGSAMTVTEA